MSNLYTAQSGWWFMCSTKDTGYYLTPTPFILRVGKSCHDAIWMYNLQLDKPSANKEKEGIALSLLMCSLVVAYISTSVSFYITWPPQTLCSQCCTMFSVALEELCQVCQVTWVNSVLDFEKHALHTGGVRFERCGRLPVHQAGGVWQKVLSSCIMGSVGSSVFGAWSILGINIRIFWLDGWILGHYITLC